MSTENSSSSPYALGVEEIARENAQPVAALFGFRRVGIENAQLEVGLVRLLGSEKDAVGTEPEIAVAYLDHIDSFGAFGAVDGVEYQIVVSERVIFREFHNGGKICILARAFSRLF